ncbi:Na+/H+ antiporter subunit E [Marinobacterium sp. AK62]|uniref:Na+/H+ antiporter subunit E n=1 Tax=Marinobacterium alkalitolerans TaxID=1542925 RepID=A0ABS3ZCE3_9GAMM|nr:Na+/H+ antiporter subunit E [Marinobacterium alkalitolerans]MBP0049372.1 Na+/H+ antiporter subunit E [Marinobacterium alkalitolerans]
MSRWVTLVLRALLLWLVWWALTDGDATGLLFGGIVSLLVSSLSLVLFPPSPHIIRVHALPGFALFFLSHSLLAAVDVSRRLLSPSLPVTPGYLRAPLSLPEGVPRWLLANTLSLLPGTLSVTLDGDEIELHCLDLTQPVRQEVEQTQRCVAKLFGLTLNPEERG